MKFLLSALIRPIYICSVVASTVKRFIETRRRTAGNLFVQVVFRVGIRALEEGLEPPSRPGGITATSYIHLDVFAIIFSINDRFFCFLIHLSQ